MSDLRKGSSIRSHAAGLRGGRNATAFTRKRTQRFLLLGLFIAAWAVLFSAGCAKRLARLAVPFGIDKLQFRKGPAIEESWREKGIRLARQGDFAQAVESFTQQVLEEPEDFAGFNALAVCYKNLGDHGKAMKNFERALEFASSPEERAKVLANIGHLYFGVDRLQVALNYYKEAVTQVEKNPLYRIFVARTFLYLDEPDRAQRVLVDAEKMQSQFARYEPEDDKGLASYLMADCYSRLNEWDKVISYLQTAIKTNPVKYAARLRKDWSDQTSLLYTLKGNEQLQKALRRYSEDLGKDSSSLR